MVDENSSTSTTSDAKYLNVINNDGNSTDQNNIQSLYPTQELENIGINERNKIKGISTTQQQSNTLQNILDDVLYTTPNVNNVLESNFVHATNKNDYEIDTEKNEKNQSFSSNIIVKNRKVENVPVETFSDDFSDSLNVLKQDKSSTRIATKFQCPCLKYHQYLTTINNGKDTNDDKDTTYIQVDKPEMDASGYRHPNYSNFSKPSKKRFRFLQRYHLADTLPVYFRGQLQMQVRSLGADVLTIGLFGPPRSGKSAFLNTIYTTMNGEYVEYSAERKVNTDLSSSTTVTRLELRVTETINVLDNRATDFSKDSLKEITKQCEGYRSPGDLVPENWNSNFKEMLKDFFKCSNKHLFRNRVLCPIFVDDLTMDFQRENYKQLIDTIRIACGYNPVVVLTHKDKIDKEKSIDDRIRCFEELNCTRIFALENYTLKKHEYKVDADQSVIEILFNCCLVADQELKTLLARMNGRCCK